MTLWVVADSSVLVANVISEPLSSQAETLLQFWQDQKYLLAAPVLLRYEIVAVMRKNVHRGLLTPDDAVGARDVLLSKAVHLMIDDALLRRGYELATRFNRPTAYDAQYLAVAEQLQCEFWTADERLFNAVKQDLAWVKWLGDFTL